MLYDLLSGLPIKFCSSNFLIFGPRAQAINLSAPTCLLTVNLSPQLAELPIQDFLMHLFTVLTKTRGAELPRFPGGKFLLPGHSFHKNLSLLPGRFSISLLLVSNSLFFLLFILGLWVFSSLSSSNIFRLCKLHYQSIINPTLHLFTRPFLTHHLGGGT